MQLETITGPLVIYQIYAPDTSYSAQDKEEFYKNLQLEINKLPRNSQIVLLGVFNAKVGSDAYELWPEVTGRFCIGQLRKQQPRLIAEISVRRRVPSWKLPICSLIFGKGFLENHYLFDSYRGAPGK